MGKNTNTYRVLVGGPEGERALGRPKHLRKSNIEMDLKEMDWEGVNSIQLAQDKRNKLL
jgi:hypothetical protein